MEFVEVGEETDPLVHGVESREGVLVIRGVVATGIDEFACFLVG